MTHAYGVDAGANAMYMGGDIIKCDFEKVAFDTNKAFILRIIAFWTEKQCKLTFYYNGKKLHERHDYTMKLPQFIIVLDSI